MALFRIDTLQCNNLDIEEVRKHGEEIKFSGFNRRLPEGVYVTDEPLIVEIGDFRGAGKDKTIIIADFPEKDKPIMRIGSTPYVEGFTICYRDGLVNGNETLGERIGISTINYWPLQKGACIRDVGIKNVGTGVYSSGAYDGKSNHAFSVMFDKITVTDFSCRGFDFDSCVRTGNVYSDIKLSSGKYKCNAAFYFGYDNSEKEESETVLTSVTIYDTVAEIPVVLGGARALVAESITLDNVTAASGDFMLWEKSSGRIDELTLKNSALPANGNLIRIGGSQFINIDTLNYMAIGELKLDNISGDGRGFNLFLRDSQYTCPYYVKVEEYEFSSDTAADALDAFPVSGKLTFTKKGAATSASRLCPFYSKTKGDDGKTLVWNGIAWQ